MLDRRRRGQGGRGGRREGGKGGKGEGEILFILLPLLVCILERLGVSFVLRFQRFLLFERKGRSGKERIGRSRNVRSRSRTKPFRGSGRIVSGRGRRERWWSWAKCFVERLAEEKNSEGESFGTSGGGFLKKCFKSDNDMMKMK